MLVSDLYDIDIASLGKFRAVKYRMDADLVNELAEIWFVLDGGVIGVSCDPDDASVVVEWVQGQPELAAGGVRIPSIESMAEESLGGRIGWMWAMVNQQGYWDGIQIEVVREERENLYWQIVITNTTLSLFRVEQQSLGTGAGSSSP